MAAANINSKGVVTIDHRVAADDDCGSLIVAGVVSTEIDESGGGIRVELFGSCQCLSFTLAIFEITEWILFKTHAV